MLDAQVPYQLWLKLPKEVRDKLVILFHIPRTGSTVVDYSPTGPVIVSDGFKPTDIEAITLQKMQTLLDTDSTNFFELLEQVIAQADALMKPKEEKIVEIVETVTTYTEVSTHEVNPPFCDQCDSKGGRHKKVCPKY